MRTPMHLMCARMYVLSFITSIKNKSNKRYAHHPTVPQPHKKNNVLEKDNTFAWTTFLSKNIFII